MDKEVQQSEVRQNLLHALSRLATIVGTAQLSTDFVNKAFLTDVFTDELLEDLLANGQVNKRPMSELKPNFTFALAELRHSLSDDADEKPKLPNQVLLDAFLTAVDAAQKAVPHVPRASTPSSAQSSISISPDENEDLLRHAVETLKTAVALFERYLEKK